MEISTETVQSKSKVRIDTKKEEPSKPTNPGKYEGDLYRTITLKELGANLPVPKLDSEGKPFPTKFSFKVWDMEMEETLSKLKGKAKTVGLFVNQLMCTMLSTFNGQDFTSLSTEEKMLRMNQIEFPNMMYMYIYLRVEELGSEFRLDVGCPTCGKLNKDFLANLDDLDIRIKEKDHPREYDFKLKRPIELDGKTLTSLMLNIGKWDSMEKADREVGSNAAKMKRLLFESCIVGASTADGPVEGYVDLSNVIKKMKKIDIERCMRDSIENNGGPLMAITGDCSQCGVEWWKELDWRYDTFFDSSSL